MNRRRCRTPAESLRLRWLGKWPLLHRGEFRLSVQSPAKLIDRPQGLLRKLPMFWQVQLVGWALFGLVDLIGQRLIFHDFLVASLRTALMVASLIVISVAMGSVYGWQRLDNRLTLRAGAWMVLLSVGGATIVAALAFAGRALGAWMVPDPGRHRFTLSERAGPAPKVVAELMLEGDPCGS